MMTHYFSISGILQLAGKEVSRFMELILNLQCSVFLSLVSDNRPIFLIKLMMYAVITDTPITSLAHNLWSRDDHIVIGFSNGNIDVYNGLTGSPKLLMSLDDKEVLSCMHHFLHSTYINNCNRLALDRLLVWLTPMMAKH